MKDKEKRAQFISCVHDAKQGIGFTQKIINQLTNTVHTDYIKVITRCDLAETETECIVKRGSLFSVGEVYNLAQSEFDEVCKEGNLVDVETLAENILYHPVMKCKNIYSTLNNITISVHSSTEEEFNTHVSNHDGEKVFTIFNLFDKVLHDYIHFINPDSATVINYKNNNVNDSTLA